MREVFQQELREVQDRLVLISSMVEEAISNTAKAVTDVDIDLAEAVIAGDPKIDRAALALDELAIEILGRQQPVATDLRLMVSSLRISASLERMGDYAENVSLLVRHRFPGPVVPESLADRFAEMGSLDVQMASLLTQLLAEPNLEVAGTLRDLDDEVDELHASILESVYSKSFDGKRKGAVDSTLVSRHLERFADHAVAITKKVTYLVSGEYA